MSQEIAITREDCAHPEKVHKLITAIKDEQTEEDRAQIKKLERWNHRPTVELCFQCGWNSRHHTYSGYCSRIRILHTRMGLGIWEVGSRWLIRDRPNDHTMGNDFMTQEFLRAQTGLDIPILKEMRKLSAPTDKVDLTLMSRADGVPLQDILHTLSPEQKMSYRHQLGDAIKKWRQFTSPVAQKVDGDLLDDSIIGFCVYRTAPTCRKMGRTTDEWFAILEPDLRFGLSQIHETKDQLIIEEKYQELKRNFPKPEPYVLTHFDLNLTNVIVKDGNITAIIDWEEAGYYPWWAERWMCGMVGDKETHYFFNALWEDPRFGWDMGNKETFSTKVFKPIEAVRRVWKECSMNTKHPLIGTGGNGGTKWIRPTFCECKPVFSGIQYRQLGAKMEHILTEETQRTCYGYSSEL